ncbi:MAG TPA: uracil phosphoribosyltransferase [Acidimicrobiales bacterium]|nr:uracil phosphoribosyltransferase [Acidimicrobiales bacterium]
MTERLRSGQGGASYACGSGTSLTTSVTVVTHPVIDHRLASLRDLRTDRDAFRDDLAKVTRLLAYEALRDLKTEPGTVTTPVCDGAAVRLIREVVLIVPVLRAGLGMVQAIQDVVPLTEVAHVGVRRDEQTLSPVVYLNRLPSTLSGRRVVVCDPMVATGGSLIEVCNLVRSQGGTDIVVLSAIASEQGIAALTAAHPELRLYCAALDPVLNEVGFIIPGLGDAGDRLFGPPD